MGKLHLTYVSLLGIAILPVILGQLMIFCLMFQSSSHVLAFMHLFFLLQNYGRVCPMMCALVFLLTALNQNLKHTYFE